MPPEYLLCHRSCHDIGELLKISFDVATRFFSHRVPISGLGSLFFYVSLCLDYVCFMRLFGSLVERVGFGLLARKHAWNVSLAPHHRLVATSRLTVSAISLSPVLDNFSCLLSCVELLIAHALLAMA